MHYRNGRPAQEGDHVVGMFGEPTGIRGGVIHSLQPEATTCNAKVDYLLLGRPNQMACVTVDQLFHADDLFPLPQNPFRRQSTDTGVTEAQPAQPIADPQPASNAS